MVFRVCGVGALGGVFCSGFVWNVGDCNIRFGWMG